MEEEDWEGSNVIGDVRLSKSIGLSVEEDWENGK